MTIAAARWTASQLHLFERQSGRALEWRAGTGAEAAIQRWSGNEAIRHRARPRELRRGRALLLLVNAPPGGGPSLHRHPYAEVFVVQQGRATFLVDDEEQEVIAGHVVVVPAGRAHRFVNSGDEPLQQIDIHASSHFITEWLEP